MRSPSASSSLALVAARAPGAGSSAGCGGGGGSDIDGARRSEDRSGAVPEQGRTDHPGRRRSAARSTPPSARSAPRPPNRSSQIDPGRRPLHRHGRRLKRPRHAGRRPPATPNSSPPPKNSSKVESEVKLAAEREDTGRARRSGDRSGAGARSLPEHGRRLRLRRLQRRAQRPDRRPPRARAGRRRRRRRRRSRAGRRSRPEEVPRKKSPLKRRRRRRRRRSPARPKKAAAASGGVAAEAARHRRDGGPVQAGASRDLARRSGLRAERRPPCAGALESSAAPVSRPRRVFPTASRSDASVRAALTGSQGPLRRPRTPPRRRTARRRRPPRRSARRGCPARRSGRLRGRRSCRRGGSSRGGGR